jgi:hypothetical protein
MLPTAAVSVSSKERICGGIRASRSRVSRNAKKLSSPSDWPEMFTAKRAPFSASDAATGVRIASTWLTTQRSTAGASW